MDDLIPVINKLQDLHNTMSKGSLDIQIPQIVVVGEQSAGKSSVLESLVGESILPRGNGIVTRCPIVLQLIHESEATRQMNFMGHHEEDDVDNTYESSDSESSSSKPSAQKSPPKKEQGKGKKSDKISNGDGGEVAYVEFLHKKGEIFTNFEQARAEIENEVNKRAGKNKGIVAQELSLTIHSPRCINLTLVDLPGIVKNAVGDQPEDIESQVRSLILSYLKNENSIILAVCTANNDLANSESIKLAREVDPDRSRTIVVMTKLDLMDPGTDATTELTGRVMDFKLGVVGVVNRGQKEIKDNRSIQDSLKNEEKFLKSKYPSIAAHHGTKYLATKLQKILLEHIRKCVPPLQTAITDMIISTKNEIQALPESSTENKPEAMLEIIRRFCADFSAAIVGKGRDIEKRHLTGGAKITEIFREILPKELNKIDPLKDLSTTVVMRTIQNHEGIESTFVLSEKPFRDLARMQILRLQDPALTTTNLVNTQIQNIVHRCMSSSEMNQFPNLTAAIVTEVTEVLNACHQEAQNTLKKYVMAQGSYTLTSNVEFNKELSGLIKAAVSDKEELKDKGDKGIRKEVVDHGDEEEAGETSDEEEEKVYQENGYSTALTTEQSKQCKIVKKLVNSYYKIVKEAFLDYCPKAIALEVIYHMEKNLQGILTSKLYKPDKIDQLVQESRSITQKRESAKRRLQDYEKANQIIGEVREMQL